MKHDLLYSHLTKAIIFPLLQYLISFFFFYFFLIFFFALWAEKRTHCKHNTDLCRHRS